MLFNSKLNHYQFKNYIFYNSIIKKFYFGFNNLFYKLINFKWIKTNYNFKIKNYNKIIYIYLLKSKNFQNKYNHFYKLKNIYIN